MMAELVTRCANHCAGDSELAHIAARLSHAAVQLLDDVFAAVPYMLLDDVTTAVQSPAATHVSGDAPRAGPPVGGVLIMHPLHIAVGFTNVVSPDRAAYMRGCLRWMAEEMGLGSAWEMHQATGPGCMQKSIADAHTVVWAGMMQ